MNGKNIILAIVLSVSGFLITEQADSVLLSTTETVALNTRIEVMEHAKNIVSYTITNEDNDKEEDNDEDYVENYDEDNEDDYDGNYEDNYDEEPTKSIIKENATTQEKMLVAHYKFENNLKDSSDNKNNGNIAHGDISFKDGKNGKAALFDGESYIEVEDNDTFNLGKAFSISVWLYKYKDEEYGYSPIL